jgi:hypothetical protein
MPQSDHPAAVLPRLSEARSGPGRAGPGEAPASVRGRGPRVWAAKSLTRAGPARPGRLALAGRCSGNLSEGPGSGLGNPELPARH